MSTTPSQPFEPSLPPSSTSTSQELVLVQNEISSLTACIQQSTEVTRLQLQEAKALGEVVLFKELHPNSKDSTLASRSTSTAKDSPTLQLLWSLKAELNALDLNPDLTTMQRLKAGIAIRQAMQKILIDSRIASNATQRDLNKTLLAHKALLLKQRLVRVAEKKVGLDESSSDEELAKYAEDATPPKDP